jgi:hypothetical protein
MPASSSTRALSPRTRCEAARAGAEALREARNQFERDGVEIKALRRCDPEGPDGTRLPSCFKVYLPVRSGKFGMVLRFVRDGDGLALRYLAFGVRHHPRDSNAQTVYASPTGGFMEGRDSDFDSYENLVPKLVPDSSQPGA